MGNENHGPILMTTRSKSVSVQFDLIAEIHVNSNFGFPSWKARVRATF